MRLCSEGAIRASVDDQDPNFRPIFSKKVYGECGLSFCGKVEQKLEPLLCNGTTYYLLRTVLSSRL